MMMIIPINDLIFNYFNCFVEMAFDYCAVLYMH